MHFCRFLVDIDLPEIPIGEKFSIDNGISIDFEFEATTMAPSGFGVSWRVDAFTEGNGVALTGNIEVCFIWTMASGGNAGAVYHAPLPTTQFDSYEQGLLEEAKFN